MNRIGDIIRQHRKNLNMTQEELGNKLFVTKQTISKWENGKSLPDLETTKKLIEILEIDSNEILGETVQEVKNSRKMLKVFITISIILVVIVGILLGLKYIERCVIEFGYQDGTNHANQYATDVTMVQLIATPERYDGKLVRVTGVGNLEFECDCIYLSKEDRQYYTDNCIWIELGDRAISYEEAKEYNGKYVVVEGFFNKDDRGHFGMFCGSIKDVSRYQLEFMESEE